MISNFSNNPLSITSRQTILRYLCAIQQEGKPECSIAAKQRTLGSKRKAHRICPSTSRTSRPCLHAPAARHHPDSSSIPTRKDGMSETDLRIERKTSHSAKRGRRDQKRPRLRRLLRQDIQSKGYLYHFLKIGSYFRSQGRFRPRAYFLLGPRSFPGECSMVTRLTTSTPTEMRPSLRDHHGSLAFPPFLHQLFNAPHLMMRLCRFPAASSCVS